jgi:WD40 repeat protein
MSSLLGVPSAKLDKHGEPKRLLSYGRKSNVNQEILGSRAFGKPGRKHLFWNDDKPNPYLPGHDILSWNQHNHFCFGFGQHLTLINVDNMDRSISWNLKALYGISSIACVANCQIPGKEHLLTLRTSDGTTCIWDINSEQIVDAVRPREKDQGYALLHAPCLDWNKHSGLLTTNSPYKSEILHRDHRDLRGIVQRISNRYFASCSRIKWNCDGTAMASTGGDCGMVHIWDAATTKDDKPRVHLDHYMAVTMDWHPSRPNLLLSGSVRPILEQTIKLWDTGSGNLKAAIDTEEATSYVLWNQEGDQFCSSHGTFDSPHYYANVPFKTLKNSELKNWKFDGVHGLTQRKSFNKICGGIYCLAQSPDGNRIGALHDGAISVWNGVFGSNLEASEQLQHFTSSNAKRRKDCNDNIWPFGTSQLGGMPVIR